MLKLIALNLYHITPDQQCTGRAFYLSLRKTARGGGLVLSALAQLLEERRFEECRNLAEETLQNHAQTTIVKAWCEFAIARSALALDDTLAAVKAAERALSLARKAGDGDLELRILTDLANGYGRLRRYGAEMRVLQRSLQLWHATPDSQRPQQGIWHALGENGLHRADFPEAARCFAEAITLAEQAGDGAAAESSRRSLRSAAIRAGRLDEAARLLASSRTFLKQHPDDQPARFWYWHDRSDLAAASRHQPQAERAAWYAVGASTGAAPLEFAGFMLHYRNALAKAKPVDAMRFACDARVSALREQRFDLAYEAVDAMIQLIQTHGSAVLSGLEGYYSRRGVNLLRYMPEQLLRSL